MEQRMVRASLRVACILAQLLGANSQAFHAVAGITLLDESSFDDYIKAHDNVFVQFCNEWSRHCKAMTPEYAKLAKLVEKRGLAVNLAHVDASTQETLVERFVVNKLPGFRFFKRENGRNIVTEYDGGKNNADALLKWLERRGDASFDWKDLLETDVVNLGSENFTDFIKLNSRVLVNFYSPWCSHCIALAPEYEAAARNLKRANRTTVLAKVDAIEERDVAKQFRVNSYPTMKYFANGLESGGPDARDSDGITKWLRRRADSVVQFVGTESVQDWLMEKRFVVALFDSKSTKRQNILEKVASDLLDDCECYFAVVVPSGEAERQNRSLMMRRNFSDPDATLVQFSGEWSRDGLRDWIKQMTFPAIGDYDLEPEKYMPQQRHGNSLKAAMILSLSKVNHVELKNQVEAYLLKHVHAWKKKLLELAWADIDDTNHDRELLRLSNKTPQITLMGVMTDKAPVRKYVFRSQSNLGNEASVLEFVEKYFAGTLRPSFKSQSRSEATYQDFVTALVGDTFEEVAFAEQHDVFVKFYAPWCGQCQKVAPVWKHLARAVHDMAVDRKGVIIAEMDSTANECVEEVPGYPHFVLYPAVKGGARRKMREKIVLTPSKYDVSLFLDFLEENARNLEDSGIPNRHLKQANDDNIGQVRHQEEKGNQVVGDASQCSSQGPSCSAV